MMTLPALLVVTLWTAAGETALLEFSAPWCAPCRALAPVVSYLESEGYPVCRIDIDQNPESAQQYGVGAIPCFIMLVDGREVDRVTGSANYDQLRQMLAKAAPGTAKPHSMGSQASSLLLTTGSNRQRPSALPVQYVKPVQAPNGMVSELLASTVRIRVADADGASYGSGTIIDVHQREALVLTCGHLFRDSAGRGEITVDLFVGGQSHSAPAQLVRYDLDRDLGLVSFQPGVRVQPIRVASRDRQLQMGEAAWVTGCDRGGGPAWAETRIVSIDKYLGPPNIQVVGQPPDGRSGGGLFTTDGQLIGVCNAADPADKQGLYAALPAIQGELDQAGLSFVYQLNRKKSATSLAAEVAQAVTPEPTSAATLHDAEVICIVRPKNKSKKSEVFVLESVSPGLIEQLALEVNRRKSVDVSLPLMQQASPLNSQLKEPQNVIRGQSPRR